MSGLPFSRSPGGSWVGIYWRIQNSQYLPVCVHEIESDVERKSIISLSDDCIVLSSESVPNCYTFGCLADWCTLSTLLGDIVDSDFAYWYRCYRSVVCWSVTFVHCAQTAEDIDAEDIDIISFACDGPMSLPDRIKIWLTSAGPFLPKFRPKVTYLLLIW